jgi:hypothetical protein
MDPDPRGPKTCGSGGSGFGTLQRAMGKFQHSTRIKIFKKGFLYLVCEENSGSSGASLSALFKLLQAVFFILTDLRLASGISLVRKTQMVFKWKMKHGF